MHSEIFLVGMILWLHYGGRRILMGDNMAVGRWCRCRSGFNVLEFQISTGFPWVCLCVCVCTADNMYVVHTQIILAQKFELCQISQGLTTVSVMEYVCTSRNSLQFSPFSSHSPQSQIQIFSSAPCSQTPSACILPLMRQTKCHTLH